MGVVEDGVLEDGAVDDPFAKNGHWGRWASWTVGIADDDIAGDQVAGKRSTDNGDAYEEAARDGCC